MNFEIFVPFNNVFSVVGHSINSITEGKENSTLVVKTL
jgi:hypothetical protein